MKYEITIFSLLFIRMFSRLKSLISSVNVVRLVAPIIERKHKMCINIGDYFIIVLYSSMQSNQILMVCKKKANHWTYKILLVVPPKFNTQLRFFIIVLKYGSNYIQFKRPTIYLSQMFQSVWKTTSMTPQQFMISVFMIAALTSR